MQIKLSAEEINIILAERFKRIGKSIFDNPKYETTIDGYKGVVLEIESDVEVQAGILEL